MPPAGTLLISGLGMVSTLGWDVTTACAAQRAGLVRRQPLDDFWCFDESELDAPVIGAPIQGLTDGFIQSGVWVRLALEALEDMVRYGELPGPEDHAFWRSTALAWILPEMGFERFMWPGAEVPALLERSCTRLLADLSELPLRMIPRGFFTAGPAGAASALGRIHEVLAREPLERVLLMGSDSWLDRLSMDVLIREGRLKTAEQPAGLCPGEAAACVLVERAAPARRRGARTEARILATAFRPAPGAMDEESPGASRVRLAPAMARNLVSAIIETLQAADGKEPFRGDILVDLNGEEWKARVWGHAQALLQEHVDLAGVKTIVPCVSFGDIGAASGVAALCIATRSFVRRYASTHQSLVCSISDNGETGAILLTPYTTPDARRDRV
ncbi:hypothetical protein [Archangium lansingense]|uniref:3-oxoacyl-[acyl-carrier-protein] synthase-1 n=1 Tax=Archangium lansingense TaxID=2995310 RepID=A0ABT4ALT2_9BACT|nr:hypothetical protein [Archangium lansinium]MCY1082653.1 hypothetical protein [Archangium lansinium]